MLKIKNKKQRHYFGIKSLSSQGSGFSCGKVWIESWTVKKAEHLRICAFELVLEKTLESPLDCKEIQTDLPKGYQSRVMTGKTDVETETPIFWPPDKKS